MSENRRTTQVQEKNQSQDNSSPLMKRKNKCCSLI